MFDKLQAAFDKEKQFTSDVSHELRTPLAVIISQSDYAKTDPEYMEKALDMIIETYKDGGKVLVCGNGGTAADTVIACYRAGGRFYLCGNGGSCADSDHIVGELMKGFLSMRPVTDERIPEHLRGGLQGALPAISLPSQSAILSAFINDVDPEMMYAQLVYGYAKEGDPLRPKKRKDPRDIIFEK